MLGSVAVYERNGAYQLYAREIRLDGEGILYERFQMLKQELSQMGMFAQEYKRPIPAFARRIGVVTAPTGAAVRDIMNIARRRNPYVQLILYPALVQGEGAKESIVRGIALLEKADVDVIIVGRGGGSMEDLWAFNEEKVARAIFDCQVPIISAVGHETDTTIADYVADLRAPTPSAAAELAVYEYGKLADTMEEQKLRMRRLLVRKIQTSRMRLDGYETKLRYLHPQRLLQDYRQRAAEYEDDMRLLMEGALSDARHRLSLYVEIIRGLSPLKKLNQGYSYVQAPGGQTLKSIRQIETGDEIAVCVTDGVISAVVTEKKEEQRI